MTVSCLIVDDEALARVCLRDLIADVPWLRCLGEAGDGEAAVRLIDAERPDLLFLDVELPGFSGLDVLERAAHRPAVIFTTAFDRYAVTAFELSALDYLLKPFGAARFEAALARVRQALALDLGPRGTTLERARQALGAAGPAQRLFVHDRGRIVPLAVQDVDRLEAEDDYVRIYAGGRGHLVRVTLSDLERRLDPARFLRVHRSHVVNLERVAELCPLEGSRFEIRLRDGTRVPVSRSRSKELRRLAL